MESNEKCNLAIKFANHTKAIVCFFNTKKFLDESCLFESYKAHAFLNVYIWAVQVRTFIN